LPLPLLGDQQSWIWSTLSVLAFILFFTLFGQRLQVLIWLRDIERSLIKFDLLAKKGKEAAIKAIKDFGKPEVDPTPALNDFLEFFVIEPVDRDPFGVLKRLEHLLDEERVKFREFVRRWAPNVDTSVASNLEDVVAVTMALNLIYKVVRHYLLLGKRTKSVIIIMQTVYFLPLIMRVAEAYYKSLDAFTSGKPIGDSAGALVAAKLMFNHPTFKVAEDMVASEVPFEGRTLLVVKAEGPGGKVGKPGDAVVKLVEDRKGQVARIIMVDAASKLEGERTGDVAEGVGAAIGDPGPEKYKIEEIAVKYKIPIDAIAIKESLEEAISTIRKEIIDGVEVAVERVKQIIRTRTKNGDCVILVGVGNTIGVGNG